MYESNNIIFQLTAFSILIIFYSIYIGKMIAQKRKGIQTNQIAYGNKSKELIRVELLLKIAYTSIIIVEILSICLNTLTPFLSLRIAGIVLGIMGIFVFGIAVYTMQDSWRAGIPAEDKTELVTKGIFKISRNPAFLAFDMVYTGILLMFFNWILLIFTLWAIIMLHLQIKQEENFLLSTFGEEYANYKNNVRRYF